MIGPLVHLALIWGAVFIAALLASLTRLTAVLYFLALGCFMVNFGFLPEVSHPFIRGMSELGIILIMFALGFEENTSNFLKSVKISWGIAFFGALAPFITTYLITNYYWQDQNLALMCALAMTATAVSLTMVALKSEGLHKTQVATRIMTSAVLDDIASLALVAILVPIATGESSMGLAGIALTAVKAIAFFIIVTVVGTILFPHKPTGWIKRIPLLGNWGLRDLLAIDKGLYATLTVLLIALLVGLVAHYFGFHPAVGAYMAGLILKEEYFHEKSDVGSYKSTKRIVDNVAFSWIGPVFFVELGTKLVFDWDIFVSVIPQTILLTTGLIFAQISSAALAARYTGGMRWPHSLLVGLGMLGRAELAFVVMDIAYVQNAIINTAAFYTLMCTAFWLNVSVPIGISLWKRYYGSGDI
ncbi:MAG: cation:proton antiporter [Gammaproteobacteria bacterium]|jgi:Kef-type K+ transport system membrane component KefB|nr:cation:proton antiporter [Gammaproteobacteria bacterium]